VKKKKNIQTKRVQKRRQLYLECRKSGGQKRERETNRSGKENPSGNKTITETRSVRQPKMKKRKRRRNQNNERKRQEKDQLKRRTFNE